MTYWIKKQLKNPYSFILKSSRKIRNFFIPTAYIVLYHRIANVKNDPHFLCVSPKNFREQIQFLKENFKIIPLAELVKDIESKRIKNKSMAITFDDGYADNLHHALPILEEFKAPATIFLTSGYIGSNNLFYWDLPAQTGENTPPEDKGRPMTLDEAKTLSKTRIMATGSHSVSHPNLAGLTPEEQLAEIAECKNTIEKMLDIPLSGFAYPFGKHNKASVDAVRKTGFKYACSVSNERVTSKSDIYALPRFIARNWDLEEFKKQIKQWV